MQKVKSTSSKFRSNYQIHSWLPIGDKDNAYQDWEASKAYWEANLMYSDEKNYFEWFNFGNKKKGKYFNKF